MKRKTQGLKCKKFIGTSLESLEKQINDFLRVKDRIIILKGIKIDQSPYYIDDNHKGNIIDISLFIEKP